jgi:hypothetical protein
MHDKDLLMAIRKITLLGKTQDKSVNLRKTVLHDLVTFAVAASFDTDWYLKRYPDVAKAIEKGFETSALDHYASSGIYEGRMPYAVPLDEADYLSRHDDVAASVKSGETSSARDHFYNTGFVEGRTFQLGA